MHSESPYYELAHHFAMYTNRSLFLTGKAGTGKTTFLRQLQQQTQKEMAIVAPTGVAAINAGGVTIHSFFQLPLHYFIPTIDGRKDLIGKIRMNSARRKVLNALELLVIDEISMVRADVLDAIDTVLRHFSYRRDDPFGGVQVIFIGDMYQLSPVYSPEEWHLLSQFYAGMYFFNSLVIQQQPPIYIEFDKIFRQSNLDFIQLLNEVRNNNISDKSFALLQGLYQPDFRPPKNKNYITLTTHNYKADAINAAELAALKGKSKTFEAKITGDYPERNYPTERELVFKIGAKVMFLKNDKESRYFNGKIGEITAFDDDIISVHCPDDPEDISVLPERWDNISYTTNPQNKQIEETVLGSFEQYPLRLAWAITIHKSQGLTFDRAVIDAGQAFASGQVYVALSRCRSLDGIVLLSNISRHSLQVDNTIVAHSEQKQPIDRLNWQLDVSKRKYREQVLLSIFDFKIVLGYSVRLQEFLKENVSSFNLETLSFLDNVQECLLRLQSIALRFQQELARLLDAEFVNEQKLQERITSAIEYFSSRLTELSGELKQSPALTDSKANSMDYNDQLKSVFSSIEEKLHIFKNIKDKFSVEQYYVAKNTLILPPFNVNAFAGSSNQPKKPEAKYPALYYQLADLRRKLCEPANLPLFLVAGTKTLNELATYLPQTLNDLEKISGLGPATIAKYGQQFLDIVVDYCQQHKLESLMHEKETKRQRKTERQTTKKEDTKKISLDLHNEGFSITEIAQKRSLTQTTIEGHLTHFIRTGELALDTFVNSTKEQKIIGALDVNNTLSEAHASLNGEVSFGEIRMVMAHREWQKNKEA